jgi:hypothetical protein
MDCLSEPNEKLVEFGVGGICNCAPDPANAAVLVANGGIPLIISCLAVGAPGCPHWSILIIISHFKAKA